MFLDESHVLIGQLGGMYNGDRARKTTLVEYGFRLPSALDNRPLKFEEFQKKMRQVMFVSATPANYEKENSGQVVEQLVRPTGLVDPMVEVRPATHQVDDVLQEIRDRVEVNERVLITTLTKRMAEQLTDYLADNGVKVRYLHSDIDTVERVEICATCGWALSTYWWASTCCAKAWTSPVPWCDPGCRQGRFLALGALFDPDHRPRGAQPERQGHPVCRQGHRLHEAGAGETERRRTRQTAHNTAHGITPRSIQKQVRDLIDGVPRRRPRKASVCWRGGR